MECEAYECGDSVLGTESAEAAAPAAESRDGWGSDIDLSGAPDEDLRDGTQTEAPESGRAGADGAQERRGDGGEDAGQPAPGQTAQAMTAAQAARGRLREIGEMRRELSMQRMAKTSPRLAERYLPGSMAGNMRSGMSMREAAATWRSEQLLAENLALKQEKANAQRFIGSAGSAGRRTRDAFDEQWYDGT